MNARSKSDLLRESEEPDSAVVPVGWMADLCEVVGVSQDATYRQVVEAARRMKAGLTLAYEELTAVNRATAHAGHTPMDRPVDGVVSLIDERDELRQQAGSSPSVSRPEGAEEDVDVHLASVPTEITDGALPAPPPESPAEQK